MQAAAFTRRLACRSNPCLLLPAEPYSLELHPHARDSLAACKAAFGGRLVLYSNSAGLQQFDPDGALGWVALGRPARAPLVMLPVSAAAGACCCGVGCWCPHASGSPAPGW